MHLIRGFLFFYLFSAFISSVYALDCQYKVTEFYNETIIRLYHNDSGALAEDRGLNFSDFHEGIAYLTSCSPSSFKVYNPFEYDIAVVIDYVTHFPPSTGFAEQNIQLQKIVSISSYSEEILKGACGGYGTSNIPPENISYVITSPSVMVLGEDIYVRSRIACKVCVENRTCLDDSVKCLADGECGSGICNIAGFCGKTRIVDCPNGMMNCNNVECVEPGVKGAGQEYRCEFECSVGPNRDSHVCGLDDGSICLRDAECGSGLCNIAGVCGRERIVQCSTGLENCNNKSCLEIGVKRPGEDYSCMFECASGFGEEGICKERLFTKVLKWGGLILGFAAFCFLAWYFVRRIRKMRKEVEVMEEEAAKLNLFFSFL